MASKPIRQTVTLKARSHDVYEALMDSRKHARFIGGEAKISRKVGGSFSVFDGYATGKNLELCLVRRSCKPGAQTIRQKATSRKSHLH